MIKYEKSDYATVGIHIVGLCEQTITQSLTIVLRGAGCAITHKYQVQNYVRCAKFFVENYLGCGAAQLCSLGYLYKRQTCVVDLVS